MAFHRVSKHDLQGVLDILSSKDILVFDTETTGLNAYHASDIFSLAIADLEGGAWYFNFKDYKDIDPGFQLSFADVKPLMKTQRAWIAHNAKFDLHFTDKAGIRPEGVIWDTEVLARLFENNHQFAGGYSLDACSTRWLEVRKDDRVKKWMDENGAYCVTPNPEGQDFKHYYFDLVPFDLISEYAAQDAIVTGQLFKFLTENMYETNLMQQESALTPVLFEMERHGVKIDRRYVSEAYEFETKRLNDTACAIENLVGPGFTDSAKFLAAILEARGFELPQTEKGTPQITDEILSQKPEDELAQLILKFRDATKRSTTYWSNYSFLADAQDIIHPNFRQSGTVTGRMSCNNPNLQNIPSEDKGPYPVRRAFIPREGFMFVSIDYKQMEFRLMLEYARELELIEKIKQGLDPHQATADLTGLSRKAAKTLNFGMLYGLGIAKLAKAIGVSDDEARRFKYKYFNALPGVKGFIRESSRRQEARGYTFDWAGRRFRLDNPKWSYKAANSIIQGGCAGICKLAMVRLAEFLRERPSRMVLQVHDEILFEVPIGETEIIPRLKEIMETAFEAKYMPLECSVSIGKNFHDLEDWPENPVGG